MAEPYEYLRDQMRLTNEGRISGQQAYSALIDNYGFISIDSFVDVLVDSYGYANLLACRIAQWILDWYRLTADGRPRFSGTLFLPSRQLAQELNVSEKSFKSARTIIRDAGIAKFITKGHRCEVTIDWVAVLDVIENHSSRNSDGTNRDSLDLDGTNRDSLGSPDGTNRDSLGSPDGTNRDSLDLDGTNRDSLGSPDGTNRDSLGSPD
ncbi:MAG: hypothetical protein IJ087_18835, partial [Eggerthellaceae bacterium]|nr:hypothetical protein [Eggerthellaceae bacterium]